MDVLIKIIKTNGESFLTNKIIIDDGILLICNTENPYTIPMNIFEIKEIALGIVSEEIHKRF